MAIFPCKQSKINYLFHCNKIYADRTDTPVNQRILKFLFENLQTYYVVDTNINDPHELHTSNLMD